MCITWSSLNWPRGDWAETRVLSLQSPCRCVSGSLVRMRRGRRVHGHQATWLLLVQNLLTKSSKKCRLDRTVCKLYRCGLYTIERTPKVLLIYGWIAWRKVRKFVFLLCILSLSFGKHRQQQLNDLFSSVNSRVWFVYMIFESLTQLVLL
jgi:hypothetical protein